MSNIKDTIAQYQRQDAAYQARFDRAKARRVYRQALRRHAATQAPREPTNLLAYHIAEGDRAIALFFITQSPNVRKQLANLAATHYAAARMFQTANACRRAAGLIETPAARV